MILVGLTGGIASGKSTVSSVLREEFKCPVIDADLIARQVVEPGKKAYSRIVDFFGDGILLQDGAINRQKLGDIIFNDAAKRRKLNSITHPEIGKAILWEVLRHFFNGERFVVLDVPLLFESKTWIKITSFNIVVYCDPHTQLERLMKRNNHSKDEAQSRIDSQMSLEEKRKLAHQIIDNNGSLEDTFEQIWDLYDILKNSKKFLVVRFVLLIVVCMLWVILSFLYHTLL